MTSGNNKSFRVKEVGLRALDGLRDYFIDVNRSDICAAAIHIYAESGGAPSFAPENGEDRPFDFCAEPIRSVLNESYRTGRTIVDIKIVFGESAIELSKFTLIKCSGLSSAAFYLTNQTSVTIDLACGCYAELTAFKGREQLIINLLKEDSAMQNREMGRTANRMGRYIAGELADALETTLKNEVSNECVYDDKRCVIKTARRGNNLFGITKKMHGRLDNVLLAVESEPHIFDVYSIPMDVLRSDCITTGENSGKGKVTSYSVAAAINLGKKILTTEVDLSEFDSESGGDA